MNDALAVVVNQVGIPLLVRPYGQAQVPATAAIGIVNAIFDAALGSNKHVAFLETMQYRVAYRHTDDGWLLTLFNSELLPRQQSSQTLQWIDRMLHLVLRPSLFASTDAGSQKFEVTRHIAFLDYIMTHQSDLELAVGIPLIASSIDQALDMMSIGVAWAGPMYIVSDGAILLDNDNNVDNSFDSWLLVLLVIAAELLLEQPAKPTLQFPVYINMIPHQMMVVQVPSSTHLVWFGLTSGDVRISGEDVHKKLIEWHRRACSLLPTLWNLPPATSEQWPALLGYCLFRQSPSPRCSATVAIKSTAVPSATPPQLKTSLLCPTPQDIYTLLGHGILRLCHTTPSSTTNQDNLLVLGNNLVVLYAVRPPVHIVAVLTGPVELSAAIKVADYLAQIACSG
ncbi:hypothetical protein H310_07464 [Aphanomyces invadans]|uniref:Uncharacterized protein n=1 Tax=Aphanomyces invadans TaxID=157072 RepID=A0A024U1D3_9STRA|nr:hypothetical protein H310_07464 [Aphanomyces invadans]ETW00025.1 hypothetical protein H310_07464 [Aphanomyces invadans]|eukprot:XP_008871050.1 hypothetical protein H310_07464 [Aphanomyces invadans]